MGGPAGLASWACALCTGTHAQKGPLLGWMFFCHHLEIRNSFEMRCSVFAGHWALQLT